MSDHDLKPLIEALGQGELVPYLGPGALSGVVDVNTGEPIPADSDSLILAMNNGRPMAPRLMWEFSRAAMNIELKRGRGAVSRFLTHTYGGRTWTQAPLHACLARMRVPYIIDINRDTQLQAAYSDRCHLLVRGIARLGGGPNRFRLHRWDGAGYQETNQEAVAAEWPILFKPMGSPLPDPCYIASDADYVDYITELMGGFAIPGVVKSYRRGRRYLLLGLRLTRDTERMVLADLIQDAGHPAG